MRTQGCVILVILGAMMVGVLPADNAPKPGATSMPGDSASQKALRNKVLGLVGAPSLAEAMDHGQSQWEKLTAEQRNHLREQAMAFLRKSPQQQEELLKLYKEKLASMSPDRLDAYRQRAEWLTAVIEWLKANDPQRIEQIKAMMPEERAKVLISIRDQLVSEGKITLAESEIAPAAQPAPSPSTRPTTQPAN